MYLQPLLNAILIGQRQDRDRATSALNERDLKSIVQLLQRIPVVNNQHRVELEVASGGGASAGFDYGPQRLGLNRPVGKRPYGTVTHKTIYDEIHYTLLSFVRLLQ